MVNLALEGPWKNQAPYGMSLIDKIKNRVGVLSFGTIARQSVSFPVHLPLPPNH